MKTIKDLKNITIEQFVSLLFEARDISHNYHLKSSSEHIALSQLLNH